MLRRIAPPSPIVPAIVPSPAGFPALRGASRDWRGPLRPLGVGRVPWGYRRGPVSRYPVSDFCTKTTGLRLGPTLGGGLMDIPIGYPKGSSRTPKVSSSILRTSLSPKELPRFPGGSLHNPLPIPHTGLIRRWWSDPLRAPKTSIGPLRAPESPVGPHKGSLGPHLPLLLPRPLTGFILGTGR